VFRISQCGPEPRSVRVTVAMSGLLRVLIADWMFSGSELSDS